MEEARNESNKDETDSDATSAGDDENIENRHGIALLKTESTGLMRSAPLRTDLDRDDGGEEPLSSAGPVAEPERSNSGKSCK